jgi:pimeloyl-ACP methyl ester carboxylesterase
MRLYACLFLGLAFLVGCGNNSATASKQPTATPSPDAGASDDGGGQPAIAAGCNPLIGDDCLTPFPSSFYEESDSTTATGVRVHIGAGLLPTQAADDLPISPDRLNQKDGFSPATPFVVYFANGVQGSALGGWSDPSASLTPSGPVQVIDFATGQRVIAFGELDENVIGTGRQGLLVHPLQRLTPGHRYVIALVGLDDASGAPLAPAPFRALRDGTPLPESLQPLEAAYTQIFSVLATAGVDRSALSLAWDIVIASDATATSHLTAMRDTGLSMVDAGTLGYTINDAGPATTTDPNLLEQVSATIDVPLFLADGGATSNMNFDGNGEPALNGTTTAPVTVDVPKCAQTATAPLPVVVFGHGLFSNAQADMSNTTLTAFANTSCLLLIGTDWIGMSSNDLTTLPTVLGADLNNVYVVTDRLQQAHLNAQVMTRMFTTSMKDDPVFQINGHAMTDASELYYLGVSLGGVQGSTFMALQPDIVRGVLDVGGAEWSLLIQRSAEFDQLSLLLFLALPDALDRQVALTVSQSEWDYADPATFGPHLLATPLPGVPLKHVLLQESIGDAQVSNVGTRLLARTIGLSAIDLTDPVPGLVTGQAPLDSAYTQFNSNPSQLPPPSDTALTNDNGAHNAIWESSLGQKQIGLFLQPDGQVQAVCGGPCTIPQGTSE